MFGSFLPSLLHSRHALLLRHRHKWCMNKFSDFKIHRCICSHCEILGKGKSAWKESKATDYKCQNWATAGGGFIAEMRRLSYFAIQIQFWFVKTQSKSNHQSPKKFPTKSPCPNEVQKIWKSSLCQAKFLTSAKFLTCYCCLSLSVILLLRIKN